MATQHHHDDKHNEMHVTPISTYLMAGGALFVLTLLTVGVAYLDFGALNDIIALLIAVTKACVIVIFFMHARQTHGITRIAMVAGLIWFLLLVLGVMDDYLTRNWIPFVN